MDASLAETVRVAPLRCPVAVDIAPLASDDVGTYELNPWGDHFDDAYLRRDVPLGVGGVVLRLYPDPATGEVFEAVEPQCVDSDAGAQ